MDAYLKLLQNEIDLLKSAQTASSADLQTSLRSAMRTNGESSEKLEILLQKQAGLNSDMVEALREIVDLLDRPMTVPQVVAPQATNPQE